MTMTTMRNVGHFFTRYWTFPTSQSPILQGSVGAGQAEHTVGVGSQVLPIPAGEYDEYSGESGGLLDGGIRKA